MPYKRRNYLINPGFQLRFLAYVAVSVLICLTTLYISNLLYFNGLTTQGQEIGLDPTHPYYELIKEQRQLLDRTYLTVAAVMFFLIMWSGLLMSHHIAGPLYKISRILKQVTEDASDPSRVHLRKRDFFEDLAVDVNSMIDTYQKEVARKNKQTLSYLKDVSAVKAVAGARLLVVEDNEINLELAVELLTSNGIEVVTASNGKEAVQQLSQGLPFDGILMDGQMPEMDGYEASRKIRSMGGNFEKIPIIAMTANIMAADQQKSIDAGMNDHVAKPISVSELFSTLAKWVVPENAVYNPLTGLQNNMQATDTMMEIEGINLAQGLQRTQQDLELYTRLLRRFAGTQRDFGRDFILALENEGPAAAERIAHSLTGVSGNIGATGVQYQAKLLEEHCNKDGDQDAIKEQLHLVDAVLKKVIANIDSALPEESKDHNDAQTLSTALDRLGELSILVSQNDTTALRVIGELKTMTELKENKKLDAVELAIRDYDFETAARLLEPIIETYSSNLQ